MAFQGPPAPYDPSGEAYLNEINNLTALEEDYQETNFTASYERMLLERDIIDTEAALPTRRDYYHNLHNTVKKMIFKNKKNEIVGERGENNDDIVNIKITEEDYEKVKHECDFVELTNLLTKFKKVSKKYYTDLCLSENILEKQVDKWNKFTEMCSGISDDLGKREEGPISDDDKTLSKLLISKMYRMKVNLGVEILQDNYNEALKKFLLLREVLMHVKDISMLHVCPLCWGNEVTHFIAPCGHVLCGECKEKLSESPKCAMCRTPIGDFGKLFFSD